MIKQDHIINEFDNIIILLKSNSIPFRIESINGKIIKIECDDIKLKPDKRQELINLLTLHNKDLI